ncbi:hypothetical protein JCM8547_006150 [Rhodosporidiobolus lusitaniae]
MTFLSRAREIAWGTPPETKAERKLLVKIDFFILSFICLMYFSNYLDRANLYNAYTAGMKEALNMEGNDLNKVTVSFTVGYTVGMIPQNLLLQFIPARTLFPVNCAIWGGLTMVTAAAKSTSHLCVIRFFQGLAEASTFVGAHVILGAWYKEAELCKRAAIFSSAAQIATIFSGVMQAKIYTTMDGIQRLHGFQWLFLICGLITLPIATYGYVFFPNTPSTNSSMVFSSEERELAVARLPPRPDTKLDRTIFRRVLGGWRWWLMSLIWIVGGELESIGTNSLMSLWMKHDGSYTVQQINYFPTGATAVSIVTLLATAVWTDWNKKRYQVNLLICVAMLVSAVVLLRQPHVCVGGVFFAFYLAGVSYAGQASNFSWANDICQDDSQERSLILASMNMWSSATNAWWSILLFPADHAPRWERGMVSIIVLCPILALLTLLARYLQLRDQRLAAERASVSIELQDRPIQREENGEAKTTEEAIDLPELRRRPEARLQRKASNV